MSLTIKNHKLTKEQYFKLFSEDISKKEYDQIISQIDERFYFIMKTICSKLEWFDYDNGDSRSETDGYFRPGFYNDENDEIAFDGCFSAPEPYKEYIPIRWLWEDFEEEFSKNVKGEIKNKQDKKNKDKVRREQRKILRGQIIESIQKKLSNEELKWVRFKV